MSPRRKSCEEPTRVYRIMRLADWAAARAKGALPRSEIDRRDGFFHLSTPAQTLRTAARYFSGEKDLVALEMAYADLKPDCAMEPVAARGGERYPHYYGVPGAGAVLRVFHLEEARPGVFVFGAVLT